MRFSVLSMATLAAASAAVQNRQNGDDGVISLPVEPTATDGAGDGDDPISLPVVSLPPLETTATAASTGTDDGTMTMPVVSLPTLTLSTDTSMAPPTTATFVSPTGGGGGNSTGTATAPTGPTTIVTTDSGGSTTVITTTVGPGESGGGGGGGGDETDGSGSPTTTDVPDAAPTAFVHVAAGVVALAGLAVAL